ncbi:MAG: hypothetical protein FJX59_09950 [Alphaproteobacteria bacterium]|nr:hypothetical protein [Alphaproteobacteria bacterium]
MIARALILSVLFVARLAHANGDEFYRFNALDGKDLASQVIFAGIIKDADGRHLNDVKVTFSIEVASNYGPKTVSYNAYTNVAGRYRSLDVASVVATLEEVAITVDPAQVQITATKKGFTLARKFNRSPARQKTGVIEVDIEMAKQP